MARTFGSQVFYGAANLNAAAASLGGGAGQYNWTLDANNALVLTNTAGVSTVRFFLGLADYKRPYITFPAFPGQGTVVGTNEFQEAFGTTPASAGAAGPGNPFSGIAAGSPASVNANQSIQFGTPAQPWGVAVVDVFAVYAVTTATLTTCSLALSRARFAENTTYTLDTPLAATGISTALTTNLTSPHVQKVSLTQPLAYETADFSDLFATLLITTQAGSLVSIYGIGLHCAVEFS